MRFLFLIFISCSVFAQKVKLDTVFCDCETARSVVVGSTTKIGPTISPKNEGNKQEISEHLLRTKFAFEKEHHSAWYKLKMNASGHLCFNIIPTKKDDDYDFMLFKADNDSSFCRDIKHKVKPVRACISRDKEDIEGKTGMGYKGKKELVKEGIGDAFVKELIVNKGEVYYLVLDNVYDNGDGHTIQFYFEEPVQIKGVITNEKNIPVMADIALTNAKGDTVELAKSKSDGTYEINTHLRAKVNYVLNFYNDSSFTYSKNVFLKDTGTLKNIKTILPQLRKGARHPIGTINFLGGSPQYIPAAVPSINNLYKLMHRNKSLIIQIEGHTNGCLQGVQVLSEQRAERIKGFLVSKGIKAERIKTLGKGCKEMLFPDWENASEAQQEQNRRVEVLVLEY